MRRLRWRHDLVALVLIVLSLDRAWALDPSKAVTQYANEVWKTRDGLPHNSITAIRQSRDGYLWLGTVAGLVRFDGVRFTSFDPSNTPALRNRDITSLAEDRVGTLWVGTTSGGITRLTDGQFSHLGRVDGLPSDSINALLARADGSMLVGTDDGVTHIAGGAIRRLPGLDLRGETVSALFEDRTGALWLAGDGLHRSKGDQHDRFTVADGLPSDIVSAVTEDARGKIWVGTSEGLAFNEGNRFVPLDTGLADRFVRTIYLDRDQNLWIGTRSGGIARLTAEGRIERFSTHEGLPSDLVRTFAEDREGNLWMGTGGGVSRFKEGLFTPYTRSEGLSDDFIWTLHADESGTIWIGTNGHGVDRWKEGVVTHLSARLSSDDVRSIATQGETLWVGTVGQGVTAVAPQETKYFTTKNGLSSDFILALYRDGNRIWVGTDHGLDAIENGEVVHDPAVRSIGTAAVRALLRDKKGTLWIATLSGLFRLTADARLDRFGQDSGLASDRILALHEDSDSIWIGTEDAGLAEFHDERFTKWMAKDGLCDDLIYAIAGDTIGNLWLTSNRGVCRVTKSSLLTGPPATVQYGETDGMRSSECSSGFPAFARGTDGNLWFPTIRGVVRIDPTKASAQRIRPPVRVEEVVVEGRRTPVAGHITLPVGARNVEIRYTALSFLAPEKIHFMYMLEGFDRRWIDAGRRRVAFYTQLPPGKFTFRVIASTGNGVWTADETVPITIPPHFYEKRWFIPLVVAGVLVLIAAGYRARIRQIGRRESSLKREVEDRTRQLKNANTTLVKLTELDPLTAIANRRQFASLLEVEWRRSLRSKTPVSLLMIDIDFFKAYNDTYGHPQGDECIKTVAQTLTTTVGRAGDLVARYGGEEFAVILVATDAAGAGLVAEMIRQKLESLNIPHRESPIAPYVTISLGIAAMIAEHNTSYEQLIEAADAALYKAKEQGKNRSVVADAEA